MSAKRDVLTPTWPRASWSSGDGHVGDRHLAGGRLDGERVDRLHAGLIPAGDEAPGVGVLELGEDGALLLAALAGVVEREEARRLFVDHAGEVERELVAAGRDRVAEQEGGGLLGLVEHDLRRLGLTRQRRLLERDVGGVELDAVGGRFDRQRDGLAAGEFQVGGVGRDPDVIALGADVGRQGDVARRRQRPWPGALGASARPGPEALSGQHGGDGGRDEFHDWAARTR